MVSIISVRVKKARLTYAQPGSNNNNNNKGASIKVTQKNINTIYLIRHGENPANVTNDFSYKLVDYSLTPRGRLQAQQTAEYFKDKHIDEVYSSPLKRAKETAEAIAQPLKLPVTVLENFREINVGSLEGRPPTQENWAIHDRIVQAWFAGNTAAAFPDGENYTQVLQRLRSGLLQVTRNKTGQNIVIVGHGGIFTRTMKDICPTLDINVIATIPNSNCSITEIQLTTTADSVSGILKMWASTEHLHGEAAQTLPGTLMYTRTPSNKQT
jgi:broad specificity phosphatase PhoE